LDNVEFIVNSFPPAYDSGSSISNKKHNRYPLVVELQESAKIVMNDDELMKGDLKIEVKCETTLEHMATDCLNLLSGIGNSLQGIVYSNDNQIKEIHFKELLSNHNKYAVRISKVGYV
jgi:Holliday junction resolvase RusA-like endonuclease